MTDRKSQYQRSKKTLTLAKKSLDPCDMAEKVVECRRSFAVCTVNNRYGITAKKSALAGPQSRLGTRLFDCRSAGHLCARRPLGGWATPYNTMVILVGGCPGDYFHLTPSHSKIYADSPRLEYSEDVND